ncbi:hypothetical protein PBRA_001082 [Plasmodiophora brassicae]|uniref:Uncharacterized protein n=1 Tax=Plasmodiophora brassicae TaxID=37360 RepID=A0A0G4IVT5_PLABS|nr:hypothetical protein PBRA_001082 [Plasmodiophora brassicae]
MASGYFIRENATEMFVSAAGAAGALRAADRQPAEAFQIEFRAAVVVTVRAVAADPRYWHVRDDHHPVTMSSAATSSFTVHILSTSNHDGFRLYDHHGRPILVSSQGELAPGSPHLAPATFSLVSATAVPSLCNFPTLSPVAALAAVADEAFRARISNPYSGTATREAHSIRPILLRQTILMSGWQLRFSIAKLASLLKTSVIPDGCSEFHGARQAIVRRLVTSLLATDSNDCDGGGSYCMPVSMNPIPHHDDPFPADVPLEHRNTYGWSAKTIRLATDLSTRDATKDFVPIDDRLAALFQN